MKKWFVRSLLLTLLLISVCLLGACGKGEGSTDIGAYDVTQPAEKLLETVKKNDFVVHEDGDVVSGQELWAEFYRKTRAGEPAAVKIADYYTLNRDRVSEEYYEQHKDDYPVIYLAELTYDGKIYTYRSINGQDGVTGFTRTYEYLMRYEDVPKSESATFTYCERYILVHDNTLTYERLQYGLYSSQMGDFIEHTPVYQDYTYKSE